MKIHTNAVEAAIEAAGTDLDDTDQPLLELARTLAAQMDDAGPKGPGTRLAATYLTTIRTLAARIPAPSDKKPAGGALARLRAGVSDGAALRRAPMIG